MEQQPQQQQPQQQPAPSRVLHLRNVSSDITQNDIITYANQYGVVQHLIILRSKNQALLQFQDLSSATAMFNSCKTGFISLRGRNVYLQYSINQELNATRTPSEQPENPGKVLLVTIQNPLYPITVDVLSQVFSPYETDPRGTVEKIVIFNKSAGLQALIQFSSAHCAQQAKNSLDGKNIYTECCTLNIQFSNLEDLTIHQNSERNRDFTNANLPVIHVNPFECQPAQPAYGSYGYAQQYGQQPQQPQPYGLPMMEMAGSDRSVLLINGLNPEQWTCDRLFNLFSNYGSVVRIKILHLKPDTALIQFADNNQANTAKTFLQSLRILNSTLEITLSKHSSIAAQPGNDAKCQEYHNNGFRNARNLRNMSPPTCMLHVSNLTATANQENLTTFLSQHHPVSTTRTFETSGHLQALVQFESIENAAETLVLLNGQSFEGQPIRLAFSKNHTN